jgi:predicted transposase/invertase (TIGR01784 family)
MFIENIDLLHDFLASTLEIPYDSIKDIKILNPELLPPTIEGKLSRMDIRMQVDNRVINIEMQIGNEDDYRDRALYLWAMLFSGELKRGDEYGELKQSICINVLDFKMFDCPEFHSHFTVMEKNRGEVLSDKCAIHFFELKKIGKKANKENRKELWLQLINAETKEDFDMLEQTGVAPIQKAVYVLHQMSEDEKTRELAWQRHISLLDYNSSVKAAERKAQKMQSELAEKDTAIAEKDTALAEKDTALAEKDALIAELQAKLNEQK